MSDNQIDLRKYSRWSIAGAVPADRIGLPRTRDNVLIHIDPDLINSRRVEIAESGGIDSERLTQLERDLLHSK